MNTFIDTHAHLPMLTHDTEVAILERARAAGVQKMITVATEPSNWQASRDLSLRDPNVWYTLGLHPHDAQQWATSRDTLESFLVPGRCVAIGELGLDFYYTHAPKELQIAVLEEQLALAKRLALPVVIHCREAFPELFAAIRRVGSGPRPGVMHCFTGTPEEAKTSLDLGFKISFSGILTFKTAEALRETAKGIPATALLLETDCPYLAPVPHRGKPTEPSCLPRTAHTLAAVRGVPVEAIAQQTTENAIACFHLH